MEYYTGTVQGADSKVPPFSVADSVLMLRSGEATSQRKSQVAKGQRELGRLCSAKNPLCGPKKPTIISFQTSKQYDQILQRNIPLKLKDHGPQATEATLKGICFSSISFDPAWES